jgi:glucosamine--fructose-6-phosphate aminotransferase (isomerizing)
MCGLFGVVAPQGKSLEAEHVKAFGEFAELARRRGSDASGLVSVSNGFNIDYIKAWVSVSKLLKQRAAKGLVNNNGLQALFGHSRLETHGFSADSANNQPITSQDWFVLHNGIITNQLEIKSNGWDEEKLGASDSDTFSLLILLDQWEQSGRKGSIDGDVFHRCEGELSVIIGSRFGDLIVYTNVGNLYRIQQNDGTLFIGSEPRQFGKSRMDAAQQFPMGTTVLQTRSTTSARPLQEIVVDQKSRTDNGATGLHITEADLSTEFIRLASTLADNAYAKMKIVARCTSCLLPETFPNIKFNTEGVCNICLSFTPPIYAGLEQLKTDLAAASPNGKDVLVCLSGGRDSCYILHLIKELGFHPTAYTYDWGMVTTAARENMAKMCGILGVEHILVSPDIQKNRARVKHALIGWLGHPDIATVPILMAGDKPYFRFAKIISKERGNLPAVMADHHLETTGFKSMLAGAIPTHGSNGGVEYRLTRKSLIRMALRYGKSGVQNPTMARSILVEGAVGFFDYYLRKHTFVRPFMYIPWDESELEEILTTKYQWSKGNDPTLPAWRMGDATAPFYNLVYGLALGMTEHDALRSNQIRYGLKTRQQAFDLLQSDNQVNVLALAAYFATTGLDEKESLAALRSLAKISS